MIETSSPSVIVTEFSKPFYIPTVNNEIAAFVGFFEKGPINKPIYIRDINQFKVTFGRGVGLYHNDWYQVYNYLQYSSGIWVCRTSGCQHYNANNGSLINIESLEEYNDLKDSLETIDGLRIIAKTSGESGNLLTYICITKSEWDSNVLLYGNTKARDIFTFFEDNYFGICIFRNKQLMEKYYINESTVDDLSKSIYVYIKININDILPTYNDTAITLSNGGNNLCTNDDLAESYEIFKNNEEYDLDIIIGNQLDNNSAIELAEYRQDCIAFIGLPTSYINILKINLSDNTSEVLYTEKGIPILINNHNHEKRYSEIEFEKLNEYLESIKKSQFCHFTLNVKEQLDGFSNKNKLVNIAADIAGLKAQASLNQPWTPGAGLEKGQIKNASDIYISFDKKTLNSYYKIGLNFIEKNILMSQKTYYNKESIFNRVNIRSLFNHIEKTMKNVLRKYVFEENILNTRRIIANDIKKLLLQVQTNRGIENAKINVYPDKTNGNIIITDISIKPVYMSEYINLRMKNVDTDIVSEIL
jgi:hypothetical protein